MNLRDYLRILRRRKWIIVFVPLLFGLSSFAMALLQAPKPVYRATASVRVERSVSVTGLLQELITYNPVGNLETQAALIKGVPVMALAAKKLGRIPQEAGVEELWTSPSYLQAALDLRGQIEVRRDEGTSLIDISATSTDLEQVARVANAVAEAFQEDNLTSRNRQVREARRYIESQLDEAGAKLRAYDGALKAMQDAKVSLSQLKALEDEYSKVRRAIDEVEVSLQPALHGQASRQVLALSPEALDPVVSKLNSLLLDYTIEREKLLLTLLPMHPQVQQIEAQIASVQQSLRAALQSRVQPLRARADDLQKSIARLRQEHAASPEATLEITRLEREVRFNERIFSLLVEKYQEALIKEKEQVAEIGLVRPAVASGEPINPPQVAPRAGVGLVIGLALGLVLAFVVEALDTSIGAIDEVESLLETSVLGVIPHLDLKAELAEEGIGEAPQDAESAEKYAFLISLFLPKSRVVEAFRTLRTNLLVGGLEREFKTLMVTSATQREGKTTVAINLAIALAQLGKRTLLVEADLRKPFLHHAFGVPKEPGLTEVLIGTARLEEATLGFNDLLLGKAGVEGLINRPGIDNIFLLPSGHQPPNPAEFLSAQVVVNFIEEVRQRYDYVVIDAAPILPVADSTILASRVDGTLMIVRVGQVPRAALRRSKVLLEGAKARILGVCLTGVRAEVSPDYADMGYYYRYRYGAREPRVRPLRAWSSLGTAFAKSSLKTLILVLVGLVGLSAAVWAWHTGSLSLSFLLPEGPSSHPPLQPVPPLPDPSAPALAPHTLPQVPPQEASDERREPQAEGEQRQAEAASLTTEAGVARDLRAENDSHPAGPYTVRVSTFRSLEKARRAAAAYEKRGFATFVVPVDDPAGARRWGVSVGRFGTRAEAEALSRRLGERQGLTATRVVRLTETRP